MLRHSAFALIAVCAIAACGAPQADSAATGEAAQTEGAGAETAQAAAAPVVTDVACARSFDEPASTPALVDAFADSDNDPVAATGVLIQAPAGAATCAGSFADGASCQVRGPAVVRVAIQDFEFFTVPAGRTATLSVDGGTTCFLNAE
ncbi:MAG: hypothetical protein AB7O04_10705 [Hyphomonadaceae bacterium]